MMRDRDRDRYLACLLSPEAKRGALADLYAFNAELARVSDLVHEPLPGEVRLQY
ncbi:squalene/phytoene synthase family protein, partial [Rhizobium ruizarguesonis]